jgi:hypothetical protein
MTNVSIKSALIIFLNLKLLSKLEYDNYNLNIYLLLNNDNFIIQIKCEFMNLRLWKE